jgi:predicted transposase YdaD
MKTDDIFYQIFQTSPALAFELMGEVPPCQYEFRAQEVKSFGVLVRVPLRRKSSLPRLRLRRCVPRGRTASVPMA